MNCQQCGQALAEWKVREYRGADRDDVLRHWYLCDLCVMEVYGPWLPGRIPPIEENQMWSSAGGGKVFRRAASAVATSS